ncbi:MAG: BofC C-terminal domain-containing protein [Clostridia bacterium]|nr:hypothetical protein [Bacillota bacterium]MBO2520570.1 hypothetical protein [Bacillota bacterium]
MGTRERWIVIAAGTFLFLATLGYTYARFTRFPEPAGRPEARGESVLEDGAELVLRHVADGGAVTASEVIPVGEELVGLSLSEVRGLKPHWTVLSFSPSRLVVDVPCEPEGPGGFIGQRDGAVAIFAGRRDGCHQLVELTGLRIESLSAEAQQAVAEGIEYESPGDLPQLLEGLVSTR